MPPIPSPPSPRPQASALWFRTRPHHQNQSDFFLALEKRDIDEFNPRSTPSLSTPAATRRRFAKPSPPPNASGSPPLAAISRPQKSDMFTLSFAAHTNDLTNQGMGGFVFPDAGYDSIVSEYDLRAANTQTISVNLLHETHAGFTWKDTAQSRSPPPPASTSPDSSSAAAAPRSSSTSRERESRSR